MLSSSYKITRVSKNCTKDFAVLYGKSISLNITWILLGPLSLLTITKISCTTQMDTQDSVINTCYQFQLHSRMVDTLFPHHFIIPKVFVCICVLYIEPSVWSNYRGFSGNEYQQIWAISIGLSLEYLQDAQKNHASL